MTDAWAIGRGVADVTGEPWGVAMMGYGMPDQRTCGILSRQYARAFVFEGGRGRVAFVVAEIGMFFQAAVEAIHKRLGERFGTRYTAANVVLTATHTHCGPGGHGHDVLYNLTTAGFHGRTFERLVSGVVEAIAAADADVAPARAVLASERLTDASANRARAAFERNPSEDREAFPEGIDPRGLLLRVERDGELVGVVHWFPVHNTSMTNRNRLISADNKGWAATRWESEAPGLVAAFAQTNAGDLSPNLDLEPGTGPTGDERENTRLIGERQLAAARRAAASPGDELAPGLDTRHRYVRFPARAILGASFASGKMTDGPGSPWFHEGKRNPRLERLSRRLYARFPRLAAAHAPKDLFLPVGQLRWVQETYLVQLVRLGQLHLLCLPFEVTVVAGLRLRRAVADALDIDLEHVVLQGYANGYGHYVTTPEEYDEQLYEGGATIFGRHQLVTLIDAATSLAAAMRDGHPVEPGTPPPPRRFRLPESPVGSPRWERRGPVRARRAATSARPGGTVTATFDADHPNAALRPTYLRVERRTDNGWTTVADDAAPDTTIVWRRDRKLRFTADITWTAGDPGTYRIIYVGRTEAATAPFSVE
ncbi:neutral/alkaline non-lysosomal ceramidase N-terminal domain-containing protein [Nocardia puris]|uniref:Neutral ceramidase n=1 Tax=Nocardia puris TaxID=208602 RepID=A0A366CXU8_9NOCA|nr:neutral/alkaline non-lysosomal ceramidase N-terminal domain-containing protein [Nocardia puris]RBO82476.1 neutral ceramidase [Nocardia puris]